jgi:prepilin-type processing-associated H-X9-DG protein
MGQASEQPARRDSLARYFPRQDLVVYVEFDGVDAHRESWKKTAAYRLLNETTTGVLLEESLARLVNMTMGRQSGAVIGGREAVALGVSLLRSGFAVGINRAGGAGPPQCFGVVIRGGAKPEIRSVFDRVLRAGTSPRMQVKAVEKPGGRTIQVLGAGPQQTVAWWVEGDDLVVSLASPAGADAIIAALEGREPSAVEHPTRAALVRNDDAPGFESVGLGFFDMAALPPLPKEAVALGLDRIKRFDYRWGFHGPALQSIVSAIVPAPRRGVPALFDQPVFDARHLPPLPGGLDGFAVFSLEPARLFDQVLEEMRSMQPGGAEAARQIEQVVQQATGLNVRDNLLAHLGPRFTFYTIPTRVNAATNPISGLVQGFIFVPKSALVVEVKDHEAVTRAVETLSKRINSGLRTLADQVGGGEVGEFKRLKGEENGRILALPSALVPHSSDLRPTLLLGKKRMVLGTNPSTARQARDLDERAERSGLPPGDPLAASLEPLPDHLVYLAVNDPKESLPELLVSLPGLMEFWIARTMQTSRFMREPPMAVGGANPPAQEESARPDRSLALAPELVPDLDALRGFLFPSVFALAVDDQGIRFFSREAFPTFNPSTAAPVALAMLVPAVHSARVAAMRAQSTNNLKQIGLALHNFHSANNHFPTDVRSKDGKLLLSWRVQLLPFLEQQVLFNEIHMDEPWDSPHNKPLLERMPAAFAVPNTPAEPGMTFYRGFSGPHALFDKKVEKGVEIQQITDGTSNTIGVVEAKEAVPWTQPDNDIPSGDDQIKPDQIEALRAQLGGHFTGGFNALFVDGSVRFIKDSVNLIVLRALITRDGGEVISSDAF